MAQVGLPEIHSRYGAVTREDWKRLVIDWLASGKGCTELCAGKGVKPKQLGWWKYFAVFRTPKSVDPGAKYIQIGGAELAKILEGITLSPRKLKVRY